MSKNIEKIEYITFSEPAFVPIAQKLHAQGHKLGARSKTGKTLLMRMLEELKFGCIDKSFVVDLIEKESPDLDVETNRGNTAIFYASGLDIIAYLVSKGADINHINKRGESLYSRFFTNPYISSSCEELKKLGAKEHITDEIREKAKNNKAYKNHDFQKSIAEHGLEGSIKRSLASMPDLKKYVLRKHFEIAFGKSPNTNLVEFVNLAKRYQFVCKPELFLLLLNSLDSFLEDWTDLYLLVPPESVSSVYDDNREKIEKFGKELASEFKGIGILTLIRKLETDFDAYQKRIRDEKLRNIREYFVSQKGFDSCATLDWDRSVNFRKAKANVGDNWLVPAVRPMVAHALVHLVYGFLTELERRWRREEGLPDFDYKWKSEAELFIFLSESLTGKAEVEMHASPKWLGRQHLDIFIPRYNVAIEYQGEQHYRPIDFFGGEEAFKETKRRDKKKKALANENGCELIYVDEETNRDELIDHILKLLESKKALF